MDNLQTIYAISISYNNEKLDIKAVSLKQFENIAYDNCTYDYEKKLLLHGKYEFHLEPIDNPNYYAIKQLKLKTFLTPENCSCINKQDNSKEIINEDLNFTKNHNILIEKLINTLDSKSIKWKNEKLNIEKLK